MDRIQHAKRIMKPFFLRRLKADVLKALPEKTIELLKVPMTTEQHMTYFRLVQEYKKRAKDVSFFKESTSLFLAIKNLNEHELQFTIWPNHVYFRGLQLLKNFYTTYTYFL